VLIEDDHESELNFRGAAAAGAEEPRRARPRDLHGQPARRRSRTACASATWWRRAS
jgi:hypothetical protein